MIAKVLPRKIKSDGYRHVDIMVDGVVFHAGIANPEKHYGERITVADNIVKVIDEHATQAVEITRLRGLLKQARGEIMNHHEFGHVVRAYKKGFEENCDVCQNSGLLELIEAELAGKS